MWDITLSKVSVGMTALVLVTAGCGDVLTGDVDLPTYPPVGTPPPPPAGAAALPAGFPREVPVLSGRYRVDSGPVGDSWALTVTDAGSGSLERAQRLLRDGGYEVEPVLGRDLYLGTRYVVTVALAEDGHGLDYTVVNTRAIPGLPPLPNLDVPTLISDPATAAR